MASICLVFCSDSTVSLGKVSPTQQIHNLPLVVLPTAAVNFDATHYFWVACSYSQEVETSVLYQGIPSLSFTLVNSTLNFGENSVYTPTKTMGTRSLDKRGCGRGPGSLVYDERWLVGRQKIPLNYIHAVFATANNV